MSTRVARRVLAVLVGVDQPGVRRAAGQQLGVGAAVDDPAALEVHHLVGQRDRGLAVGDHDQRRVGAPCVAERGEDARLDLGVDRRGGVVEDQQPRPADQRAGQRDPLPLAAGERGAALAQLGVEPVGERGDEAVGLGGAQRRPHLLVGHVRAEGDVAADVVVEEERRLRHQRRDPGQLAAVEVAQVDAVEQDPAAVGVDQPGQQRGERALAGRGGADDRDGAARLDGEVDVLEQPLAGRVGVAQVLDLEPGAAGGRGRRRRGRRTGSRRSPRAPG